MPDFKITSDYTLQGDQPLAVEQLVDGLNQGHRFQTLLGATGTGKTFTMANVIQHVQKPTLVIAHNKTLAAQLCSEFREFFPENAVEYFVSYYDYYQPEAYIPQTDTYIEKDAQVNDEIDRLRHSATQAVLERKDVIVVASVSCIYGLGSPEEYSKIILSFRRGEVFDREQALHRLVDMQFTRNNMELNRGTFRVRGDILELQPIDEEVVVRVEYFGDEIEKISLVDPLTGEVLGSRDSVTVFPASHFVTSQEKLEAAIVGIEAEMHEQVARFTAENKLIEAQRIEQRTRFDIEMMGELGYCSGIENYSRFMDGRAPGTAPNTLFDYFIRRHEWETGGWGQEAGGVSPTIIENRKSKIENPLADFLVIVDESHQTIPQLRGMYAGDMARKDILVEFGFRLPSAKDNRPLKFPEWEERVKQVVFVSATPGPFEKEHSAQIVQQVIRPTGLVDPEIIVRPTKGQIDDLIGEIRKRTEGEKGRRGEGELYAIDSQLTTLNPQQSRVLVTTLTKRMSEDLSEYLQDLGIKVQYLHSDIKTLERTEILRELRTGAFDVLVGINLLREGLDLPEVSLVAILDADKEGFLRSDTSLIQTIGRAARNAAGQVIMYADNITGSMERAIDETNRRRAIQVEYNEKHGITPQTVQKAIRELIAAEYVAEQKATYKTKRDFDPTAMPLDQVVELITDLEREMKAAAKSLDFEHATALRDEILELKRFVPSHAMGGAETPQMPKRYQKARRAR